MRADCLLGVGGRSLARVELVGAGDVCSCIVVLFHGRWLEKSPNLTPVLWCGISTLLLIISQRVTPLFKGINYPPSRKTKICIVSGPTFFSGHRERPVLKVTLPPRTTFITAQPPRGPSVKYELCARSSPPTAPT